MGGDLSVRISTAHKHPISRAHQIFFSHRKTGTRKTFTEYGEDTHEHKAFGKFKPGYEKISNVNVCRRGTGFDDGEL